MPKGRKIVACPHCGAAQSIPSHKLYHQCTVPECGKLFRVAPGKDTSWRKNRP